MKSKELHLDYSIWAKLSVRIKGQIKCCPDRVKPKEFTITKQLLYEMLKGLL